jgi:hypothetical protein
MGQSSQSILSCSLLKYSVATKDRTANTVALQLDQFESKSVRVSPAAERNDELRRTRLYWCF